MEDGPLKIGMDMMLASLFLYYSHLLMLVHRMVDAMKSDFV
jgi:hypothetical protein